MAGEYTEYLADEALLRSVDDDENGFAGKEIIEFLNDAESFAPFGERLGRFIREYCGLDENSDPKVYLKEAFRKHGIEPVKNTLNNWFSKGGPKKGDGGRESIIQIAFMLDLDEEKTNILLNRVYLDRKLDCRSPKEYIFCFCLRNHISWRTAQEAIFKCRLAENPKDHTVATQYLDQVQAELGSCDEVLDFIESNSHNFRLRFQSAEKMRDKLIDAVLKEIEQDEESVQLTENGYGKRHPKSKEQMVRTIIGVDAIEVSDHAKRSYFKNARLPKEIINRFPEATEFSKPSSYEQLRKMIILLASYLHWHRALKSQDRTAEEAFNIYKDEIDNLLREIGYAPLYYGNPYDWIFLYSALQKKSLNVFRDILAEAIIEADD